MKIARVAIDVPLNRLFDYYADDVDADDVGRLVEVPFRSKTTIGVIVDISQQSDVPRARLKSIVRVLRDAPALTSADLHLMKFAAGYYHFALGPTIMGAIPALLRRGAFFNSERIAFSLSAAGAAIAIEDLPPRASVQRRLLGLLRASDCVDGEAIGNIAPTARLVLKEFERRGWINSVRRSPQAPHAPCDQRAVPSVVLTAEQSAAAATIRGALHRFAPFILFGVTGSGKTEVYLNIIDSALCAGRQTLILVPEIALTPQLENTVRNRFPDARLVTLHSALNETERFANWRAAHCGEARIVLGTRLAAFASMPDLGLIIVDEEHDASFKQSDGLRYSARDLAVVRARQHHIPVVLGSATPSLETYYNALSGRYQLLTLRQRINGSFPHIDCINTRDERLPDGLSPRLLGKMALCLERGEQSLIFINRRGFAPVVLCRACGWLSGCHRCSAHLVLHQAERRMRCHHCGHESPIPTACPHCGAQELGPLGQGTQRIEAALREHFPGARILRIDRDSTRRKPAWPAMRREIENRAVDILVGTQILAKGHDFPHLSLVGIVNADSLLYNSDVRASERLYALLTQVAGRAGRAQTAGEVLIQTDFPNHPLYRALKEQDFAEYARTLLEERRQGGFPPYVHQALLRAEAAKLDTALAYLTRAARIGRDLSTHVTIYDPVPAAMPRLAGRERAQLLVQSRSRTRLQAFLKGWNARLSSKAWRRARWSLDVDPLEF